MVDSDGLRIIVGLGVMVDRLRQQVDQLEREKAEAWGLKFCCNSQDCNCQGQPVDPPTWWYEAQEKPGWKLRAEAAETSVGAADKLAFALDGSKEWGELHDSAAIIALPEYVYEALTAYRATRIEDLAVLEAQVAHYKALYYQNKVTGISDSEYDALRMKLGGK